MTLSVLLIAAVSIALVHTLIGPDHYLPFIVLARAGKWSLRKTLLWTGVCGVGHVLSSVLLGAIGIALGWAVSSMEQFEGTRGAIAAYALIGFGAVYMLWGLWQARKGHLHLHIHGDGSVHAHPHDHAAALQGRLHLTQPHDDDDHLQAHRRTFGALFIIFVLGPCEPLIPLLMVPAAAHSWWGIAAVAGAFGVVTIGTMLATVTIGMLGLRVVRAPSLARYGHAMAGLALVLSGTAVQLLGI